MNIEGDSFKVFVMLREALILTFAGIPFYDIGILRLLRVYATNHESLIVDFKLRQLLCDKINLKIVKKLGGEGAGTLTDLSAI